MSQTMYTGQPVTSAQIFLRLMSKFMKLRASYYPDKISLSCADITPGVKQNTGFKNKTASFIPHLGLVYTETSHFLKILTPGCHWEAERFLGHTGIPELPCAPACDESDWSTPVRLLVMNLIGVPRGRNWERIPQLVLFVAGSWEVFTSFFF